MIGKVKAKGGRDDGRWVSATVRVQGIKRKLMILPRSKTLDGASLPSCIRVLLSECHGLTRASFAKVDGNELDDEDPPEFMTIEAEFSDIAKDNFEVRGLEFEQQEFVRRKYAFGIKGVPRGETNWVEATCDFPSRSLPLSSAWEFWD